MSPPIFFTDIFFLQETYQALRRHDFDSTQKKASGESRIDDVPNVPQLNDFALEPSEYVLTGLHRWVCERARVCTLSDALQIPDIEGLKIIFNWYPLQQICFRVANSGSALHKTQSFSNYCCKRQEGYTLSDRYMFFARVSYAVVALLVLC